MNPTALEMRNISKWFPGVQALDEVDFSCLAGEVHALVGLNGAGKSTLMKILAGVYRPDQGRIMLGGRDVYLASPKEAQRRGISTIYQEFNLIPEMNVAENIYLGNEPLDRTGLFIDRRRLYQVAGEVLGSLQVNIDLRAKVKDLSVAQQQMVEIAKALCLRSHVIVMDEPTAVVSGKELESLFRIIRSLRDNGKTIIYISHRINEVFEIADRVTVLRDGKLVGTARVQDLDEREFIRMMIGRGIDDVFPARETGPRKEILVLKNVSRGRILKDISLTVHTGEILGITGLVGAGRTELARVIFGLDPPDEGEIIFNAKRLPRRQPKASISAGIGFVTEDRKGEGLFPSLSTRVNVTSVILDRLKKWFFLDKRAEKRIARDSVETFNITPPHLEREVQYLSGGNQQKVILARWMNADSHLVIMDEPTRGIDVAAKAEFYALMRMLARQGKAVIMISSELPEVIGMSDRVVVMQDGRIEGELSPEQATEEAILMLAAGQRRGSTYDR